MKIIINLSNLYVGGGVQVAISFLNELKSLKQKIFIMCFSSKPIRSQLIKNSFSST